MLTFFSKSLRRNIQQLFVDMNSLEKVKNLIKKGDHIVLMPYHKSIADFAVLFTANMMLGLPAYYTFTCSEDTPKVKNFDDWLSCCGAIRCKR